MQVQLWHASGVVASNGSATTDSAVRFVLVVLLGWLIYLTTGLIRSAVRLMTGLKLLVAVLILAGVPLAAILVVAVRFFN